MKGDTMHLTAAFPDRIILLIPHHKTFIGIKKNVIFGYCLYILFFSKKIVSFQSINRTLIMKPAYSNKDDKADQEAVNKKTVLIVDDEPEVLVLLKRLLNDYETITANDGREALDTVKNNSFINLILLDIAMPDMTGFEVAKKLKEDTSTSHIPIIFVSGKRDLDSFVEGFELGIEDYITKPIDQNYLLYSVESKLLS